jgi:L-threonylcarbamoyladenylate synthase
MEMFDKQGKLFIPVSKARKPTTVDEPTWVVDCAFCVNGHSLIDKEHSIHGYPGIRLAFKRAGSQGEFVISSLAGELDKIVLSGTLISFAETQPLLLRPGGTALEDIQSVIGDVHVPPEGSLKKASPGRQLRHYAPKTPLAVGAAPLVLPGLRKGLISLSPPSLPVQGSYAAIEILSAKGNLEEAAANLFSALHRLDNMNLDVIVTSSFPNYGLGIAIRDRLSRASQSRKKDA